MNKFQFMYKTIRHAKTKIKPFTYFNRILKNTMCLYNFSDLLIYSLTNYYVFYYVKDLLPPYILYPPNNIVYQPYFDTLQTIEYFL